MTDRMPTLTEIAARQEQRAASEKQIQEAVLSFMQLPDHWKNSDTKRALARRVSRIISKAEGKNLKVTYEQVMEKAVQIGFAEEVDPRAREKTEKVEVG